MMDKKFAELIAHSAATKEFTAAIRTFIEGLDSELIRFSDGSPRIKVQRVLMKLLEVCPDEKISSVRIVALSSCSAYQGSLVFEPGSKAIEFNWDCHWKAQQENMISWYGMPDQIGAVQKFGYQCFERFERGKED